MYDVIIIGGGPAGLTAALYAARGKLDTLLIEKMFSGGQMATTFHLENYPGFEETVAGPDLALKMENQAKRFGAVIINEDVTEVTLDGVYKTVKTTKNTYQAKTVILCMGASPKELGLEKEVKFRGAGVSYCATCDGAFFRDKVVAVVGGGDTAAEDVLYLTRFCKKVYLIHRRDTLRATKVLQDAVLEKQNVEPLWNSVITDIKGEYGVEGIKLKNIKTDEEKEIELEGLFIAIGSTPNSDIVKGKLELNNNGYIVTDESMQTNLFGVYAAGDIREKLLRQVVTAASDGAVAAYTAEKYISENKW